MVLLDKHEFGKILSKIKDIEFNTYFAQSVIVGHAQGRIYVNNMDNPTAIYIVSDYGMTLLFGYCSDAVFNQELIGYFSGIDGRREKPEWLQASPRGWDDMFGPLIDQGNVEKYSRVNFSFDKTIFYQNNPDRNDDVYTIIRTPVELFSTLDGLVVPKYFWKDINKKQKSCRLNSNMILRHQINIEHFI